MKNSKKQVSGFAAQIRRYILKGTNMLDKKTEEVRKIIDIWNPLEDKSSAIEDLSGYQYEAMDIMSSYKIIPGLSLKAAVKNVIEGAFKISLNEAELDTAVEKISRILDK